MLRFLVLAIKRLNSPRLQNRRPLIDFVIVGPCLPYRFDSRTHSRRTLVATIFC
jgi:hypothetical protein